MSMAQEAATRALNTAGLGSLAELVGQPWTVLVMAPTTAPD